MAARPKGGGLGRGLGALFADYKTDELENNNIVRAEKETPAKATPAAESRPEIGATSTPQDIESAVILVDINDIKPNENQPRKRFDPDKITELAESIKEHGIIQPLVLRKSNGGYELVAGERRWRAAREAGLKKIPGIVKELTDQENMLVAIIENMQREDLNPVEEAEGISQMLITYGLTQEQVSKSLGKSRPYITNALRLLTLPADAQASLASGEITAGHARALLSIKDEDKRSAVLQRIIKEGLSVRDVEVIGRGEKVATKPHRGRRMEKNREVLAVEQDLKEIFGTKVNISTNGKKGAIELEYYSIDELNRLIDLLKTVKQ